MSSQRYITPWSLQWPRSIALVSLLIFAYYSQSAVALDGDLALGEWMLQLKSRQFDTIFPQDQVMAAPTPSKQRKIGQRHKRDCHLSIFANGTFALCPTASNGDTAATAQESKVKDDGNTSLAANGRLVVHGRWFAANNPYCATDEFYQSIRLESYPRRQTQSNDSDGDDTTRSVLQRNQLVFHGRLAGHFQRGRRRRRPAVGRITYGKIVLENLLTPDKETNNNSKRPFGWHTRPIVASFMAQQMTSLDDDEHHF